MTNLNFNNHTLNSSIHKFICAFRRRSINHNSTLLSLAFGFIYTELKCETRNFAIIAWDLEHEINNKKITKKKINKLFLSSLPNIYIFLFSFHISSYPLFEFSI